MRRTSTGAHVYMRRHQGAKVKHLDVSNVIYHKFSHGAVSYTLNGDTVNVMLEYKNNFVNQFRVCFDRQLTDDDFIGRFRNAERLFSTAVNADTCMFMRHSHKYCLFTNKTGLFVNQCHDNKC